MMLTLFEPPKDYQTAWNKAGKRDSISRRVIYLLSPIIQLRLLS
jgi:hypothetical protein